MQLLKLASDNFQVRQAATKALKARPEAALALNAVLRSSDLETRKRAAEIIDFYERRPVRELRAAADEGRGQTVIEMVAKWPKGKYEEDVWFTVRDLARKLSELHQKKGGEKIKLRCAQGTATPLTLCADQITESTKAEFERLYFLRAGDVDVDTSRIVKGKGMSNAFNMGSMIVAARDVRMVGENRYMARARKAVAKPIPEDDLPLSVDPDDYPLF